MKCPSCGSDDAYVGFYNVECINPTCKYFIPSSSLDEDDLDEDTDEDDSYIISGGYPVTSNLLLSVTILDKVKKSSSILISFKADGDAGIANKVVEFRWSLRNKPLDKHICTLSSKHGYYVVGVDADDTKVYKTHWLCSLDGIAVDDPWELEASIQ